ncbi:alpha/beta fold hydrolase [Corynebacterium alimapuense]|nr:alpha/beta fold hydrolase [Corynebacterium alimapuense]
MTDLMLPETATEQAIADIWATRTGVSPVGKHDRFSDLGGSSLAAETALVELRNRLGREIGAQLLATDPTVAELAEAIEETGRQDFHRGLETCTHLTPGNDGKPMLFCFAGAGASAVCFLDLARYFSDSYDVWAFHAHGFHSKGRADRSLAAKARRHVPKLMEIQPTGPLTLIGHSFGGHVAMEAARQLTEQGRVINQVLLLDTFLGAVDGGSVADYRSEAPAALPPLRERLLTHWRILTAGLIPRDVATQQSVFWEQEIRIQNRIQCESVPPGTTVLVSDEGQAQQELWLAIDQPPTTVRTSGSHLSVLSDRHTLALLRSQLATPESA